MQSFNSASPRLLKAINVAAWAHRDQLRKATQIPYVSHAFGVMSILASVTDDEDVLIAGLFHDILEDVPEEYSAAEMKEEFGSRVLRLVQSVTKDDSLNDWQEQSDAYLATLREAEDDAVLIAAADKLHNITSTLMDLDDIGDELWNRFSSGAASQKWWYGAVSQVVGERFPEHPLAQLLAERVAELDPHATS